MSSPYHSGEVAVQKRVGVRAQAEELANMYGNALPETVADFLAQHEFAVLSSQDGNGNIWASPLAGAAGIFSVPNEHDVRIHLDHLDPRLDPALALGELGGLLVIYFDRRLRIRINGILGRDQNSLTLHIAQFYGNCTKYIQRRIPAPANPPASRTPAKATTLSDAQRDWIARSDTFFIATTHPESGADASHRGGRPGFVTTLDERTLTWPDYRGNNMFNTLGNLESDPRAGLLFVDFDSGASLQLTGKAAADFGDPTRATPTGRSVRFEVSQVREHPPASSLRYSLVEPFPYNPPV